MEETLGDYSKKAIEQSYHLVLFHSLRIFLKMKGIRWHNSVMYVCLTILVSFFNHLFNLSTCRTLTQRSHDVNQFIRGYSSIAILIKK